MSFRSSSRAIVRKVARDDVAEGLKHLLGNVYGYR